MVTMRDVAQVAQVSSTTVSHVINKSRHVDPATTRAVLAAIETTGYAGDGIARSLRKGTTQTIGLAMSAISNPYFGEVVHAIERAVSERGFSLLLADTHDDPPRERRAVGDLISHRVDALVLAASAAPGASLDLVEKRGIPAVLIDRVPHEKRPGVDAIGVINYEPTAQLVDHLVGHGHRRVATITSTPGLSTTDERLAGYREGLLRNGLLQDPELEQVGDDEHGQPVDDAVERLLALADPPTAMILGNNQVTIGTMAALRRRKLDVPADIALATFDDFPWADLFHPRLTAISQPVQELGEQATSMLFERLSDRNLPPRHRRLAPTFIQRNSCGCTG